MRLRQNETGFIPMMIAIVLVILAIIVFAYLRVRSAG